MTVAVNHRRTHTTVAGYFVRKYRQKGSLPRLPQCLRREPKLKYTPSGVQLSEGVLRNPKWWDLARKHHYGDDSVS